MNAQDLKNSILQLAIQGKLVEQREEEGTAKELLEKIQVDKKQLIKEGKIKKSKVFTEITDDELPFYIPDNWEWVRLINLGVTQTGNTPSRTKTKYFGNFIPFISPGDILDGVINYNNQGLSEQGKEVGRISERNSILQVCIGGSIGKCAINTVDVSYNQQINAITPLVCNHLYLYYLMDSKFFLVSMSHKATGTATPIINKTSWESIVVPLPPLEEQKRIVAKIEELLPYVDKYDVAYSEVERLNKKFPEDMQKSILQYAVEGKLVEQREEEGTADYLFNQIQEEKKKLIKEGKIKKTKKLPEITDDEIPFEIPESWKWVRLVEVGEIVGGGTPKTGQSEFWNDGDIPWLTPADMKAIPGKYVKYGKRFITKDGLKKSSAKLMPKGTIIYSSRAPIGYIGIAENDLATNQGFKSLVPYMSRVNEYMYYCLIAKTSEIISRASGTTFKEISGKEFGLTLVPLPPLEEQKRIVAKIEELLPYTQRLVK